MFAAAVVARSDMRSILGWLVTVPWRTLNLTAHQDVKAELGVCAGFPFLGSACWVAAYARIDVRYVVLQR